MEDRDGNKVKIIQDEKISTSEKPLQHKMDNRDGNKVKIIRDEKISTLNKPLQQKMDNKDENKIDFFKDGKIKTPDKPLLYKMDKRDNKDSIKMNILMDREVIIPARTEKTVQLPCRLKEDMLNMANEIQPGVHIGNCLVRSEKDLITVNIINLQEENMKIKNITINLTKLSNYHISKLKKEIQFVHVINKTNQDKIDNRLKVLEENLQLDDGLNTEERNAILDVCKEFNDIFYLPGDKLSHTNGIEHSIPLKQDQAPINQKMYRLPEIQKGIINEQVEEMLENDIITTSKSPWNSPLLVVPKKDGPQGEKRWRVVVDFRKLNQVTIGDAFPLPRIEDILDQLGHSRYFTTLDLASGYHQVLVKKEDRAKTAFSTTLGHFEFKRMPFGLTGAPATFQRLMNHVLTGINSISCMVYLDDVVLFARNLEDHNKKLKEIFQRFRNHNLKLQPAKCQFLRKEVVYLGHKCSNEGALPDPTKLSCVQSFPRPKTVRQVQSFLGLANYYRKFIANFSKIAEPINKLLRKDTKFKWTDLCEEAFVKLKKALIAPSISTYPDLLS